MRAGKRLNRARGYKMTWVDARAKCKKGLFWRLSQTRQLKYFYKSDIDLKANHRRKAKAGVSYIQP